MTHSSDSAPNGDDPTHHLLHTLLDLPLASEHYTPDPAIPATITYLDTRMQEV